jgi:integrase
MRHEHNKNPHARPDRAKTSFDELVTQWKAVNAGGWSPGTAERYEQVLSTHLLPEFGNQPVSAISRERVRDYLARLQGTRQPDHLRSGKKSARAGELYSPATVRKVQTVLSSIMSEAVERQMVTTNPCHRLGKVLQPERLKDLRVLTQAEVHALADGCTHHHDLILTAAYTGLRAGELQALRPRDIDLENGQLHVRRAIKGWQGGEPIFGEPKTKGSRRTVDLADDIAELLRVRIQGKAANDLVFTNTTGGAIRQSNFGKKHFNAARDTAIPDHPEFTFHDLRHCFVSWLLAAGVDLMTVAQQAGHANPAITAKRYAHVMPSSSSKVKAAFQSRTGNVIEVDFRQAV